YQVRFIRDEGAMKRHMGYDHRRHAGNAGDLWKHLVLAETAGCIFEAGIQVYVESHAGHPEYALSPGGEWEGGIGRLWPHREELARYSYFQILEDLNPAGLERYPGSASIVIEIAKRRGINLRVDLWDTSPEVERAWRSGEKGQSLEDLHIHIGDGFSGARKLTRELDEPALLLVDSPYLAESDAVQVEELISRSAEAGWIVLSWQMIGLERRPRPACKFLEFDLRFEEAGLVCGPWVGATMILAWEGDLHPDQKVDGLLERLGGIEEEFLKIRGPKSESFYPRDPPGGGFRR
ncbi:MAG: 23S rRNA (adenine(2030)-N(6))-methyltransferase RlmJ, partial [Methanothrix sp.]